MSPRTKADLRRDLASRLAEIDAATARQRAERVAQRVLQLPELKNAQRVLTCLSFGNELHTWGLVDQLLASGRQVYVPRAERRGRRLHVHAYPCALETLNFGLRQPPPHLPAMAPDQVDSAIDVVLVLALAFDRRGYRLGHGGGYFDRFLVGRPFPAIGLAYDCQILDQIPVEPHDVAMTVVVAETMTQRLGQ